MQRQFRLHRRSDFRRLRAEGKTRRDAALIISVVPNGLPHNRYGFIVSRRIGNAVIRNRLRRHLREAVRSIHPRLNSGYDVALIPRKHNPDLTYWELRDRIIKLMRLAALIQETDETT